MKKFILFAAILFAGVSMVKAEGEPEATYKQSGSTTLTVELKAIQSIIVDGQPTITYSTADHYGLGASSEQPNHLSVVSAGGYVIRVEADDLTSGGTDVINAGSINVKATAGANSSGTVGTPLESGVTLAESTKDFITGSKGAVHQKYNVTYTGDKDFNYMVNYNADSKQTYTTTVHYTISPK